MTRATWRVAALLFFSGASALVYQTVWLRQFRLIFGASTYATGAVLAIFMAGLGIGSALLGKRADRKERPLGYYANLELLIAAAAAVSPLLLWLAAKIYFASGGSPQLGIAGATLLRLALAVLILGPATILMGGTLPAAARAVETNDDRGRRGVALLYGVNTLGAVAGTLLSTFVLLETFGNRRTLLMAVMVNLLVGVIARAMSREDAPSGAAGSQPAEYEDTRRAESPPLHWNGAVYAASAVAGLAFLLMELVWYRMLSPILGGTTYMFGLILAIALAGIGLGGGAYALLHRRAATPGAFAITCSLEALAIAIPFALGDRLAVLALVLRDLGITGFDGYVVAWTIVTAIVVFPAAFIAGIQFPLLIALLGEGREHVGRQIGAAYAWNTAGAIAGSLAGGFGLIPLLSAPGAWRLVAVLLILLAGGALVFTLRARQLAYAGVTIVAAIAAGLAAAAVGPTALWRHSSIGAGTPADPVTRNELISWRNQNQRGVVWDRDGRESSVALVADTDLAFVVNGKSDGAAVGDAGTQVMLGLAGAALHPRPRTALVVGLGTGSTAGWLAALPSMQRVDVVELEPVVLDVARACRDVNAGAMENPKLHVTIGDAREVLLTTGRRYDLIASEPSNPFRAGIASLFTRDFYEAAARRLEPGGLFLQWLQMYNIDTETMQTVYATIGSVFPHVQTWQTTEGDLMLLASAGAVTMDAAALRSRLAEEPYRTALLRAWQVDSLEGYVSRFVANEAFAREAAASAPAMNTDDRTVIEFGFARSLHSKADVPTHIATTAERMRAHRPLRVRGDVDWVYVDALRRGKNEPPRSPGARIALARALARRGDPRAADHALILRPTHPLEAAAISTELLYRQNRHDEAIATLVPALALYRRTPWVHQPTMSVALQRGVQIGVTTPQRAQVMYEAFSRPFATLQYESYRRSALLVLASRFDNCGTKTIAALQAVEPHPFWTREQLALRARCYARAGLVDLAEEALDDLHEYDASELRPIVTPRSRPARP